MEASDVFTGATHTFKSAVHVGERGLMIMPCYHVCLITHLNRDTHTLPPEGKLREYTKAAEKEVFVVCEMDTSDHRQRGYCSSAAS